MLPATQHVLGHRVQVVTPMLPSVIVVVAAREAVTYPLLRTSGNNLLFQSGYKTKVTKTNLKCYSAANVFIRSSVLLLLPNNYIRIHILLEHLNG